MTLPAFIEKYLYLAARSLVASVLQREIDSLRSQLRACETDLAQSRAHVASLRKTFAYRVAAARRVA